LHRGSLVALALVTLGGGAPLSAQRLSAVEAGAGAALTVARHTLAAVEVGAGYRPGGQSRIAFAFDAGLEDKQMAARAQLTAQFLVTPAARRGTGVYGGIGVAIAGRRGTSGRGYLALLLGLEAAPGRRGGWYAELGLAGGARIAAGWRSRWFQS